MRFTEIISEAGSPAQQAAIAIAMKKAGKKPKSVAEGSNDTIYPNAEVIKSKNGKPVGEIYQDGNSWGAFHYRADRGYDFIDSREEAIEALKDLHQETGRSRPDYTIKGVAEGLPGGFSKSDYMPGATVKNPNTSCKRCNGRGTLWKAPDGKILPANDVPGAKKYKCGACDGIGMAKKEVDEGENWSKHNNKRAGGMSKKSVASYRRSHPGSKIQTAVTTKPSKLKKGSKAAARRKSFCARMRGMKKHRTGAKTANDPNSNINKSLRRWHCESIEELHELVMLGEQYIRNNKK
jgi:hypothetical protein